MRNKAKKIMYSIIAVLSLASVSLVGYTTNVQAASKKLVMFPKKLRGYWFGQDGSGYIYHITTKHIEDWGTGYYGKKKSFLQWKKTRKNFTGKSEYLSKKLITNKTFTLYQTGNNCWKQVFLSRYKKERAWKITRPLYLKSKNGHRYLTDLTSADEKKILLKGSIHPVVHYRKVSTKYLKSIGFY